MERAQRSTRNRLKFGDPCRRRRSDHTRHTLTEISQHMLRMIGDVTEAWTDKEGHPVFFMQQLVGQSGSNIHKRRVYEVLHFWEALGLIRRAPGRGAYTWHGEAGYNAMRARLEAADPDMTCPQFVNP